jgi:topoisomerase IA-like protein
MKDVISSIQDEANNLRDLKIVDFLNDNEKLSKVALPIFVVTFTAVTSGIVYALLRRRRKNPKGVTIDPEIGKILENHRKKQERAAKRAAVKKAPVKKAATKKTAKKKP